MYHPGMTLAPMDILAGTSCQLVPHLAPWGPGWYLVSSNTRVEAGPFVSLEVAEAAAEWMLDNAMGVHPAPWEPRYSSSGLLVGSRVRDRGKIPEVLALTG